VTRFPIAGDEETDRDREVMLVLTRRSQFPKGSAEHTRMTRIWFKACGTLRPEGQYPDKDDEALAEWDALVVECRKAVV
jgi:hypothetical protein